MTITDAPTMPELAHVAPGDIEVKTNVRSKVDDGLVASVKALGVLVPLLVSTNGAPGKYVLIAGGRRRAAAIKAKLASVPCYIVPGGTDASQLTRMLAENLARADLSAADTAAAFEQLEGFGMTPAEIGAATATTEAVVDAGLRVAKSKTASTVSRRYDLTLEQSAALVEFEGNKAAIKELTVAAREEPARFDHFVAKWRQEAERQAAREARRAELAADGVQVLDDDEHFGHSVSDASGSRLENLKGADGKNLDEKNHKSCPGHRAAIDHWGTRVVFGCIAPVKHGHRSRWSEGQRAKADLTDAEVAKARLERRELIHRNKAMKLATPIRRKYVTELLQRKVAPAGTLAYVTEQIVHGTDYWLTDDSDSMLEALTGQKVSAADRPGPLVRQTKGAADKRLPLILLAKVAACIESTWQDDVHRNKDAYRQAAYLRFLESTGYGLADVEQVVCLRVERKKIPKTLAAPPVPKSERPAPAKKAPAKKAAPRKAAAKKATKPRKAPVKTTG